MRRSRTHDREHFRTRPRVRNRTGTRSSPRARAHIRERDVAPRYGREYGRYGGPEARRYEHDFAGSDQEPIPDPWGGIYPPVPWGGGAVYGLEGGGPSPFELYGLSPYDDVYDARRRSEAGLRRLPRESPAYGRGADAELRRWARQHGYDAGYAVRPRSAGGRYRWRGRGRRSGGERRPGRPGPRR